VYNTVEWVTFLANLASGRASRGVLYLSMSGFEGSGVGAYIGSRIMLTEGWKLHSGRCGGVLTVPWTHSARDGTVVLGMAAQRRGWPHRAEVTEETCPAGLTSRHRPA
jgi:hypothetical protein